MAKKENRFRAAHAKNRRYRAGFTQLMVDYTRKHKVSGADLDRIKDLIGQGRLTDNLWASDMGLRKMAARFLGEALEDLRNENRNLKFHFWTLIPAVGHTSDRAPIIDLKAIRSFADRTFRSHGLAGVYVIEIQGLGNYPNGGKGRTLMVHVHALTWSEEYVDLARIETKVSEMECWATEFDAAAVRAKEVGEGAGELYYLAHYLLKPPAEVKMIEERVRGKRMKNTEKGLRPEFASRIFELLSQVELDELIRSVGSGKVVRNTALRRLKRWHQSRRYWAKGRIPDYMHEDLWRKYRTKKKRVLYLPYVIKR